MSSDISHRFIYIFIFFIVLLPLNSQDFNRAYSLFESGVESYKYGEYQSAIDYFNEAEPIFSQFRGRQNLTAYTCLWRGIAYYCLQDYNSAVEDFLRSVSEAEDKGFSEIFTSAYTYLGNSFYSIDKWSDSNSYYEKALDLAVSNRQPEFFPSIYEGLGNIEFSWGRYDSAEELYFTALGYAEEQNIRESIISIKTAIGKLYYARNDFENSIKQFQELLAFPDIGQSISYCNLLDSIGSVYFSSGNFDKALYYYNEAMDAAIEQNIASEIIRLNIHLGNVYLKKNDYMEALDSYLTALPLADEYGRIADKSVCLSNIAQAYLYIGKHESAIPYFEQAIALKEQLRLQASGMKRLDYLASEIHVYHWLALTYLDLEDYESALNTIEFSSARYLKEQLLGNSETNIAFSGAATVMENLEPGKLIIEYGSSKTPWLSQITVTDKELSGRFLSPDEILEKIPDQYLSDFTSLKSSHRGLMITELETPDTLEMSFDDLITYYRLLLISGSNEKQIREIGRILYDFLLAPVSEELLNADSIIIVSEGILAFLPFETLIMEDGRYLIEEYDISYVQSLAVSEIVSERNYSERKNDFIGFGGAEYGSFSPENYPEQYKEIISSYWSNLPGTVSEIENISGLFISPDIHIGDQVSETVIKSLSSEGILENYRIIHFAAHGLVLPENPELSALVVTDKENEDGYLSAGEITGLNIKADFVNLSACETGLGKIYGGEGTVGLAQSFLIAGANSLSVSLWNVSDISTKDFMTGFYELIVNEGYSYKEAMCKMKRLFIQSEEYSHPYYWAPFIFYGK